MIKLTLRLPDHVAEALRARAETEHRSLNGQIIAELERALRLQQKEVGSMDGRHQRKVERIKQRLLAGEDIRTANSTTGVRYTVWSLASRADTEQYLDDPIPGEHYVVSASVFEDPTAFDPYAPHLRPLDEAAEIIAELGEV